ncbi:MAG TPA: hypothetical protein EYP59_09835 [Thiotrichaceae bacterium]|nr:hypothetical protein [Thiotrichaceae bacterium]
MINTDSFYKKKTTDRVGFRIGFFRNVFKILYFEQINDNVIEGDFEKKLGGKIWRRDLEKRFGEKVCD